MNTTTAIAVADKSTKLSDEQVDLIRSTIAPDLTDDELSFFVQVCNMSRLDPFNNEIHAVKRSVKDRKTNQYVDRISIQIGIDGFRRRAAEGGEYVGQEGPLWCGPDGQWVDVWLDDAPPKAAKVGVRGEGDEVTTWGIAKWDEYKQTYFNRKEKRKVLTPMWKDMSAHMLAKCAEAQALRKRFPRQTQLLASPRGAPSLAPLPSAGQVEAPSRSEWREDIDMPHPDKPVPQLADSEELDDWGDPSESFGDRITNATEANDLLRLGNLLGEVKRIENPYRRSASAARLGIAVVDVAVNVIAEMTDEQLEKFTGWTGRLHEYLYGPAVAASERNSVNEARTVVGELLDELTPGQVVTEPPADAQAIFDQRVEDYTAELAKLKTAESCAKTVVRAVQDDAALWPKIEVAYNVQLKRIDAAAKARKGK